MNECGISFLIHGPSKAGKTYLADTAPAPRLLLDVEGNTRFLKSKKTYWDPRTGGPPAYDGTWDTCIVYVRDFGTLATTYQWLASGKHNFQSFILDSVSEAQQRCVDVVAGDDQMKLQQWGELLRKMSALIRSYRDLLVHPTNPLRAVVLTAMTKDKQGKWTPYVQGQLETAMPYYIDVVGFLRAQPDETGGVQRMLLTQQHPSYEVGDRTGMLPGVLINPNLSDIIDMVCAGDV